MQDLEMSQSKIFTDSPPIWRGDEQVVVVTAPVVLVAGRLLLVPFDDQDWDRMLADMAAHHTRNAIGWSLTLVAAALLTVAGLAMVRRMTSQSRLTAPATIGIALGWTATAAIAGCGLLMGEMADSSDQDAMVLVLTRFNEGAGNIIFALVLAGVAGNVLLAVTSARVGATSRGVAVLFAVGALGSLVGAPGPIKPIAVTGAVLLVCAHLLMLRDHHTGPMS